MLNKSDESKIEVIETRNRGGSDVDINKLKKEAKEARDNFKSIREIFVALGVVLVVAVVTLLIMVAAMVIDSFKSRPANNMLTNLETVIFQQKQIIDLLSER